MIRCFHFNHVGGQLLLGGDRLRLSAGDDGHAVVFEAVPTIAETLLAHSAVRKALGVLAFGGEVLRFLH